MPIKFFSSHERLALKRTLKRECERILLQRVETVTEAIKQAQDSANSESKSSMGDKYETSRAMGQLDADMNSNQLREAQTELKALLLLNVENEYTKVVPGAVVIFENTMLFISSGLGVIRLNDAEVITLSLKSPLFNELRHKQAGETFLFRNGEKVIELVF